MVGGEEIQDSGDKVGNGSRNAGRLFRRSDTTLVLCVAQSVRSSTSVLNILQPVVAAGDIYGVVFNVGRTRN